MGKYKFKTTPMKHQLRGLKNIIDHNGVYGLVWEMGAGKTKVCIDYAGMLAEAKGSALVMVFAPLSAVDTWPDEVERHLPDRIDRHVEVLEGTILEKAERIKQIGAQQADDPRSGLTLLAANLDVLSHSSRVPGTKTVTTRDRMKDAIRGADLDLCIVDESHRIKGRTSNVSKAFQSLARDLPRRIILTGTLAPHSPLDIWAQWAFLNPERFGNFGRFRDRYAVMGGFRGKEAVRFRNLDHLAAEREKDSMVVRTEDVMDLPPTTDRIVPVRLTPKERKAYDQMRTQMVIDETPSGTPTLTSTSLVKWLRLRQLTSGYVTEAEGHRVERFGHSKTKVAVDLLDDLVSAGEKVVVFCDFRPEIADVAEQARRTLPDRVPVKVIHGGVDNDERRAIRKQFLDHDGPIVVVAQVRTVSLAVNEFVAASHALYLSMSARRDDYEQSRGRLDRKGQTRPVTFHHLVVKGSIDEAMLDAHRNKKNLEDAVLDHVLLEHPDQPRERNTTTEDKS